MPPLHFIFFLAVSMLVFLGILAWVLRARPVRPSFRLTATLAFVVVVIGMCFARFGANSGLPWPVYYGVPAATTIALPPVAMRMRRGEFAWYLVLAFVASPAIHAFFSFFIGWHEYLPFWHI